MIVVLKWSCTAVVVTFSLYILPFFCFCHFQFFVSLWCCLCIYFYRSFTFPLWFHITFELYWWLVFFFGSVEKNVCVHKAALFHHLTMLDCILYSRFYWTRYVVIDKCWSVCEKKIQCASIPCVFFYCLGEVTLVNHIDKLLIHCFTVQVFFECTFS